MPLLVPLGRPPVLVSGFFGAAMFLTYVVGSALFASTRTCSGPPVSAILAYRLVASSLSCTASLTEDIAVVPPTSRMM